MGSAVSANPWNPYLAFNFRVKWDCDQVAAFTSVSSLSRETRGVEVPGATGREVRGGTIPGRTDREPVRLERGITTDWEFETGPT